MVTSKQMVNKFLLITLKIQKQRKYNILYKSNSILFALAQEC